MSRTLRPTLSRMSRHPPFKALEASRPAFGSTPGWTCTQSPSPEWLPGTGTGTNETLAGVKEGLWTGTGGSYKAIDPETTPPAQLYKMMISAIVRPSCALRTAHPGPHADAFVIDD